MHNNFSRQKSIDTGKVKVLLFKGHRIADIKILI